MRANRAAAVLIQKTRYQRSESHRAISKESDDTTNVCRRMPCIKQPHRHPIYTEPDANAQAITHFQKWIKQDQA